MKRSDNPNRAALLERKRRARRKREGRCNGCEALLKNDDYKSCPKCRKRNAKASSRKRRRQPDYQKKNYEYGRITRLKHKFNMTLDEYNKKFDLQAGACAICSRITEENVGQKKLAVDHCHVSKNNRGLLCDHCNRALGQMGDDSACFRLAADYLDFYKQLTFEGVL